jgi:hypothetical protein
LEGNKTSQTIPISTRCSYPSFPASNFPDSQKSPTYYTNQWPNLTFTTALTSVSPFLDHANRYTRCIRLCLSKCEPYKSTHDKFVPSCPFPSNYTSTFLGLFPLYLPEMLCTDSSNKIVQMTLNNIS